METVGPKAVAATTGVLLITYVAISASGVFLFGGAYWMLLSAALIPLAYTAFVRPEKRPKLALGFALAVPLIFGACVSSLVIQYSYSVRGLNMEARGFFTFLAMVLSSALAYYLAIGAEQEIEVKKLEHYAGEVEEGGRRCNRCRACCFPCCATFMLLLLLLASIHAIVLAAEFQIYLPPPEAVVDVGGYNMFARCTGEGSPPVVMFHGYTGNSLDFQW